eukprot:3515473-Ditylum_brightwellii.AAC.1
MSDQAESRSVKSKLYRLNNSMEMERKKWPHTGHWKFVQFQPEGSIKDAHIANMFRAQNWYLRNTIGIS